MNSPKNFGSLIVLIALFGVMLSACGNEKAPKKTTTGNPQQGADAYASCKTKSTCQKMNLDISASGGSGTEISATLGERLSTSFSAVASGASDRTILLKITKFPSSCSVSGQGTNNPSLTCNSFDDVGAAGNVEVIARDTSYVEIGLGVAKNDAQNMEKVRSDDTTKSFSLSVVEAEEEEDSDDQPNTVQNGNNQMFMGCLAGGLPGLLGGQGFMGALSGCMQGLLMGMNNNNNNNNNGFGP